MHLNLNFQRQIQPSIFHSGHQTPGCRFGPLSIHGPSRVALISPGCTIGPLVPSSHPSSIPSHSLLGFLLYPALDMIRGSYWNSSKASFFFSSFSWFSSFFQRLLNDLWKLGKIHNTVDQKFAKSDLYLLPKLLCVVIHLTLWMLFTMPSIQSCPGSLCIFREHVLSLGISYYRSSILETSLCPGRLPRLCKLLSHSVLKSSFAAML